MARNGNLLRLWAWALCMLLAVGFLLARWHGESSKGSGLIETNLLAMLPPDARHSAAEQALERLSHSAGERVVLLVGSADPAAASRAADAAYVELTKSTALREVSGPLGRFDWTKVLADYAAYRFYLLRPENRAALRRDPGGWLQGALARRLMLPVDGPGLPLADDPFGLFGNVLRQLPLANAKLAPSDGWLTVQGEGKTWRLLSARLAGDSGRPELQDAVLHAIDGARARAQAAAPVEVLATGTVLFAAEARHQAESEMNAIGSVSTIGIVLLMLWLFRTPRHLILALTSVASGLALATAGTLLLYPQLNLLTLVMGASLVGVAVDYPVQVFARQLVDGARWQVVPVLHRLTPGLLLGLLTTLLGYGMLLVLPFPGLRQIAVFSGIGLIGAWLTVQCLCPLWLAKPLARRDGLLAAQARLLHAYQCLLRGRRVWWAVLALVALTLPGLLRLKVDDDVRQLIRPSAALASQEARIRALTGIGNSGQFFLVQGADENQLLERSAGLSVALDRLVAQGRLQGYSSLSAMVPAPARQQADHALLKQTLLESQRGQQVMGAAGLRDELIARYLGQAAADAPGALTIERWLQLPISTPLRHLWLGRIDGQLACVVMPQAFDSVATLEHAAAGLPGVMLVDKAGSTSQLFGEFRRIAAAGFAVALLLTAAMLAWRYRWRRALVLLLPTVLATLATLGLFGYLGVSVHFFIALAFMLVLGIGIDYVIFVEEGGADHQAAWLGVLLSACTALLSFGLLMLSATPAVHGFGLVLLAGVLLSVLLTPLTGLIAVERAGAVSALQKEGTA
jgi:predicted exporter